MGFFNRDMEDMLEVFQTESMELMERMEAYLIAGEKQEHLSVETLQGIFRIVHTMKSSSAMMGLETMSGCTHRLEDLFLIYREAPERAARVREAVIDLLYAYVDYVRSEMERITDEDYQPVDASELMTQIRQQLEHAQTEHAQTPGEHAKTPGESAAPAPALPEISVQPEYAYQWKVHFQDDCQMENVRAFLLLKQIQPLCSQLFSMPENLQEKEATAQIRRDGLLLSFTTSESEQVFQKLASSVYVKRVEDLGGFSEEMEPPEMQSPETQPEEMEPSGMHSEEMEPEAMRSPGMQSPGIQRELPEQGIMSQIALPDPAALQLSKTGPRQQQESAQRKDRREDTKVLAGKMGMVSWQKILMLQNVTGELIMQTNMLEREIAAAGYAGKLEDLVLANRQLLHELEELVNAVSLMPISGMVNQYNRAIRDICKKEGKDISFQVQGEELEVDKTLIDSLTTPLLHLIRNAADHGIESHEERERAGKPVTGKILFSVSSVGGNLFFSVSDDGRGLDRERILDKAEASGLLERPRQTYTEEETYQFIFRSGFSTAAQVSEYSGRGVGLNVVQKMADMLRGSVFVESSPGAGTTVTVSVPVSLTSVDSIQFYLGKNICFIPTKNVVQIYDYHQSAGQIREMDGNEYFLEEELLPLVRLRLAYEGKSEENEPVPESCIMVVRGSRHKMALVVDQIEGQFTIVEKALPDLIPHSYKKATGINGCAVTADGMIGFILNIDWIMRAYERGDLHG